MGKTMRALFFCAGLVLCSCGGEETSAAWDAADFGEGAAPLVLNAKAGQLAGVIAGIKEEGDYVVNVSGKASGLETIAIDVKGARISVRGGGKSSLKPGKRGNGLVFAVKEGALLILRRIAVQGEGASYYGLVEVEGCLIMEEGAEISNYKAARLSSGRGAVSVFEGGVFIMNAGAVHSNISLYGAGVYVSGGSFIMAGGEIYGNTATSRNNDGGAGVQIGGSGARFEKRRGGVIRGAGGAGGKKGNTAVSGPGWGNAILVFTYPVYYRDDEITLDETMSVTLDSALNTVSISGNFLSRANQGSAD